MNVVVVVSDSNTDFDASVASIANKTKKQIKRNLNKEIGSHYPIMRTVYD